MLPEVPGILDPEEVAATVDAIAAVQLPDGMIPWFPGGHADAWNHVEAAMALMVGGRRREAERAYEWLAGAQLSGVCEPSLSQFLTLPLARSISCTGIKTHKPLLHGGI